jgi:hypothetical protein
MDTITIGRIVLYMEYSMGPICPAIVTAVRDGGACVNLMVFPDCGIPYPAASVPRTDEPKARCWHWPARS